MTSKLTEQKQLGSLLEESKDEYPTSGSIYPVQLSRFSSSLKSHIFHYPFSCKSLIFSLLCMWVHIRSQTNSLLGLYPQILYLLKYKIHKGKYCILYLFVINSTVYITVPEIWEMLHNKCGASARKQSALSNEN